MKLSTNLTLSGQPVHLVDHDIVLDLSAGGRASLTIEGTATKGQTLTLDTGYNGELRRWFTGYVYDVQPAANGASKLLCRELAGALGSRLPVSQQHATLRGLLAWLILGSLVSPVVMAAIMAAVAGIMVALSVDELMPLAKEIDPNNNPSYGVLCGMSVMGLSLVLLQTAGIG